MEGECIGIRSVNTPSDTLVPLPFGLQLGVSIISVICGVVVLVVVVVVVVVRVYAGLLGFVLEVCVFVMALLLRG
jgi:hypothetical protein